MDLTIRLNLKQTKHPSILKVKCLYHSEQTPERVQITVQQDVPDQIKPCGFFVLFLIQWT
jgi:hypothetical protein